LLRVVGIMLMSIAFAGGGFAYAELIKKEYDALIIMMKAVERLREEIQVGHTPLPEALERIGNRENNYMGTFFLRMVEELSTDVAQRFLEVWKQMMETSVEYSLLTEKERQIFEELGSSLGYLNLDYQLSAIELFLTQMEDLRMERKSELKNKRKVSRVFGVASALLVSLILI